MGCIQVAWAWSRDSRRMWSARVDGLMGVVHRMEGGYRFEVWAELPIKHRIAQGRALDLTVACDKANKAMRDRIRASGGGGT